MIFETKVKYDKDGNQVLINRIKSSACIIIGFSIIVLSFYFLSVDNPKINYHGFIIYLNRDYVIIFSIINILFLAPVIFIYPIVREMIGGRDEMKGFVLSNLISVSIKLAIGYLFKKNKDKKSNIK